tara:strand:- start:12131 stop:13117 length:987 start_codon:yes stop_codon:yes gene_type:complete
MFNEKMLKPRIVVSKCLEFDACRYNGEKILDQLINQLANYVEFIPICPEVEIGLGVPRAPIRLVKEQGNIRLKQPVTKKDLTTKMDKFAESFLSQLKAIDGFILKGRSPSCGIKDVKVYPSIEKSPMAFKDVGIFANHVKKIYPNYPKEEEGRLTNQFLREHFLTSIFTLSSFRELLQYPTPVSLINFHARNKYLLMTYNQKLMREMGKLVSSQKNLGLKFVLGKYQKLLRLVFRKQPRKVANINTYMHVLGYFSEKLKSSEKAFFLDTLTKFRNGIVPLSVLNNLSWSWIIRFDVDYLKKQTFFRPFPEELSCSFNSANKERVYKSV